jgi:transposase
LKSAQIIKQLQEQNELLRQEIAQRDGIIAELRAENALLRQKVDLLVRRVFGSSSEKLDPHQLELLILSTPPPEPLLGKDGATLCLEEVDCRQESRRIKERVPRLPADLPVVEEVIEPKEVQQDPQPWTFIGAEVSELLDYQPARFFRRRLIRNKYVRRDDKEQPPIIAELPPSLQERCIAAPGLLAQIIVAKYCDHLPLYRQESIFSNRHDVQLPRQTMARWMGLAADWLRPIYDQIRSEVLTAGYVQVDETPIRYLSPGNGQAKLGYLWIINSPGRDAVFDWHTSRSAECLKRVIPDDFRGVLQSDAYSAYQSFANTRPGEITLAGCWAHARRRFFEAQEQAPQRTAWLLRQIAHLYHIESILRDKQVGPAKRAAVRSAQSLPIYNRIYNTLAQFKMSGHYLPRSAMGRAIDYALSNWQLLGVYLDDGRVEIDNNLVENAIRPTAIGKKNYLFFGDADAGHRSAILYTIVEACRRRHMDPYSYLRDVLTRLPSMTNWQINSITPEAWTKDQQQKLRSVAEIQAA